MKIYNAGELKPQHQTVLIYGAPGIGKTTALGSLPGKTLIIDVDRGTDVLIGKKNIDIVRLDPDLKVMGEIMMELEKKCTYENVCLDSLSELERGMLGLLGRTGRNGGAPELAHYNQVNFKMVDLVRRLRLLDTNIILTAWEEYKDVIAIDGTKYTQTRPMLSGKTADNICGLCDIVGQIIISPKDRDRYIRLQAETSLVAKDRILKRAYCAPDKILTKEQTKEETNNA